MGEVCKFWADRRDGADYCCPDCNRALKVKMSNTAKNPGREFVSCSKNFGGCGLFCFMNEEPRKVGGGFKRPRDNNAPTPPRAGGTNVMGPVAATPGTHELRLAELATAVDKLTTKVDEIMEFIRQVNES